MRILIVSASDLLGGASRAAFRLHQSLNLQGQESYMLVGNRLSNEKEVIGPRDQRAKLKSFLGAKWDESFSRMIYRNQKNERFSAAFGPWGLRKAIQEINPDLVHIHWMHKGTLNLSDLPKIHKPLVWTLHDMWAFTGGCHYDMGCGKYTASCHTCPVLGGKKKRDMSHWVFQRKKRAYSKTESLAFIACSNWMKQTAKTSSLLKDLPVHVIPNGIDTKLYKPIDKGVARKILNLPQDKKLVLFGALNPTGEERKGYHFLPEVMNQLTEENVEVVVIGSAHPQTRKAFSCPTNYLGKLNDDSSLVLAYSAADVVILPSIQENLANTAVEALACGTPVVAFDIGGNSDMIEHLKNGFLAQPFDCNEMSEGVQWVLQQPEEEMRHNTRTKVLQTYTYDRVAQSHIQLYQSLCSVPETAVVEGNTAWSVAT